MIIKGKSRAGPIGLAAHLGNAEKNEKVQLLETRGTVATDLRGALIEMDAYGAGTRCEKSLYHAAMSPEPPHRLTPEQRSRAIDVLEERLGFTGHARVVVMHEKEGRQHLHVVWSRIDLERMRAVSDSHNYRKHEEVARQLEREFGHDRVQGAHHEREGVERPTRTPSRSELRQEERTGIKAKDVRADVTAAYRASDSPEAFVSALHDRHYVLAHGDRRDYVVVDRAGGIHSLARRIEGVNAAELRAFMAPLDPARVMSIEEAQRYVARWQQQQEGEPERERQGIGDDYITGADYVSQSRAALRDFRDRQERLDRLERRHEQGVDGRADARPQSNDRVTRSDGTPPSRDPPHPSSRPRTDGHGRGR